MAVTKTNIEWTDSTWSPIRGCSRVSEGCRYCYAETVANRFKGEGQPYEGLIAPGGQWNGKITVARHLLDQPLRWRQPRRVFVNSMSDLFHDNVPEYTIDCIFAVMAMAERHKFQILTKRPQRMLEYVENLRPRADLIAKAAVNHWGGADPDNLYDWVLDLINESPLANVWLGVSAEDQKTFDERVGILEKIPAAVRWVSLEPLLGPIKATWEDISDGMVVDKFPLIDWVVVGGESGKNARPMHLEWARSLRDQCQASGTAFFMKQMGGKNKMAMPEIPPDLMIREYPQ